MCDKPRELVDLSQSKVEGRNRTEFFDPLLDFDDDDDDYDYGHEPEDLEGAREYSAGKVAWFANKEIFPRFSLDEVPHPKRDE